MIYELKMKFQIKKVRKISNFFLLLIGKFEKWTKKKCPK